MTGFGEGVGEGYGYGFGYSDADGNGVGSGYGNGYGHGLADGYGTGVGEGYGFGYGYEDDYGHETGSIGDYPVLHLHPWPYAAVGCQVHSIETWRTRWREIAADQEINVDAGQVDDLLRKLAP